MFRATLCPSSGETTVFMWHLVPVILCGSTQNNRNQVSHKHSCFSWWWAHSRPKHVEIDKYTKNKLCTKMALFTRLYRDAQSTEHKIWQWMFLLRSSGSCDHTNISANNWPRGSCYLHLHPFSTYITTWCQKPEELWYDRKTA